MNAYKRSVDSDDSDEEPDEDPGVLLLAEAGRVPGIDISRFQPQRYKKKKNKKKKRRKQLDGNTQKAKKSKTDGGDRYVITRIVSNLKKPAHPEALQNCLMISEWLVQVPEDFEHDWVMVPCPLGKRMLVVATSGSTRCYAKSGNFMFYFQSALPGGHLAGEDESSRCLTILDCIWHHKNKTYYVLDALSWNNTPLLHCEAKFRFFWLEQKLPELSGILSESDANHYGFSFLPRLSCNKHDFTSAVTSPSFKEEFKDSIDGFLFYDLSAPYVSGTSSAVGWLKPFMIPDVFSVSVASEFLLDRPDDYTSVEQYISEFEKNKKLVMKNEKRRKRERILSESVSNEKDCQVKVEGKVNLKMELEDAPVDSVEMKVEGED